jgi:hypothetical protein
MYVLNTKIPTPEHLPHLGSQIMPIRGIPSFAMTPQGMALVTTKLDPIDFPKFSFWKKTDYTGSNSDALVVNGVLGSKGKTRVTKGINVTARYIENHNGTIVNGHQVTNMRAVANQVFHQLLKCN